MKQTMQEGKRFFKQYAKLILLAAVAVFICFGFQAFNGNIRIDTEEFINAPGSTLGWLYIGRYGLVLLKRLLGLMVQQTVKSGVLMLLFFFAGSVLATFGCYHFSGEDRRYPYWLFLLLYATSNIWSFQFYFSMQQAEIALAMLLLVIAAIWMCHICFELGGWKTNWKRNVPAAVVSVVFLVIGLASYQAIAVFYITLCVVFFLLYLLRTAQEQPKKGLLCGVVFLAGHFVASYVIYTVIANTWFMAAGDYMENQSNWGVEPIAECIKNVLRVVRNQLKTFGPRNFSFYTAGIVFGIAAVVILIKKGVFREKKKQILFVLAMLLLYASPFLMTLYAGAMLVTRTQFALPVASAFLAMFSVMVLCEYGNAKKWAENAIKILGIVAICMQIGYNLRLHEADRLRYEHDTKLAEQVTDALKETCGDDMTELPVLFVGYQKPQLPWYARRSEMYGWSFFEWDYSRENATGATHRIQGFLKAYEGVTLKEDTSEPLTKKATELVENMEIFPAEGSVLKTDDLIVVKLSEPEERTDIDWW